MRHFRLPARLMPWALRAVHLRARFVAPLTIGVRGIVVDEAGRVFLVKHSYVPGWHIPGGGVEPGEAIPQALRRELREEANVEVTGPLRLQGIYFNGALSRRDHVAVYVVRDFRVLGPRKPDWEIIDGGFFDPAQLPEDVAPSTKARLIEMRDGLTPPERW